MTRVKSETISPYEEVKEGLSSLVKQTAQVGAGFLVMLLLTGGQPPDYIVALSFVAGVVFVAWSEYKRLTKPNMPLSTTEHSEQIQEDKIKRILEEDRENFSELVKTAGLDPAEDFAGANLAEINGVGCNMRSFNFSDADLSEADLSRADLREAKLMNAKLIRAKLIRADLSRADLTKAQLMDADFSYADIRNAILEEADLINTNLCDADLREANLTEANLNGANVENARFGNNAGLSEAMKADLRERGAIFTENEPVATQNFPRVR